MEEPLGQANRVLTHDTIAIRQCLQHMALLQGTTVYECTTGQIGSACISRSLSDFMASKAGTIIYLFGPR